MTTTHPNARWSGLFLLASLALGAAGCGESRAGVALPCAYELDCPAGQTCDDMPCVDPSDPNLETPPRSVCGDGLVENDEVCDDGAQNGTAGHCNDACDGLVAPQCGNAVVEAGETCDDGADNGLPLGCNDTCDGITPPACGNGVIEEDETCDDGADNGLPLGCSDTCDGITPPACGNGVIEEGETCDDGTDNGTAYLCNDTCDGITPRPDLGEGNGQDVLLMGDSWMNLTGFGELGLLPAGFDLSVYNIPGGIQQSVVRFSGDRPYRQMGVPGTMLLDGVIPGQYYHARNNDADILTVIMTGGGNDILLDMPDFANPNIFDLAGWFLGAINNSSTANCALWSGVELPNLAFLPIDPALRGLVNTGIQLLLNSPLAAQLDRQGQSCRSRIDAVAARYKDLIAEMAEDGVQDLVIVIYTRHTWIGPAPINYVWQEIQPLCDNAPEPMRCHMIDADVVNNGGPIALLEGIHPDTDGYHAIGRYVYDYMVANGMRR